MRANLKCHCISHVVTLLRIKYTQNANIAKLKFKISNVKKENKHEQIRIRCITNTKECYISRHKSLQYVSVPFNSIHRKKLVFEIKKPHHVIRSWEFSGISRSQISGFAQIHRFSGIFWAEFLRFEPFVCLDHPDICTLCACTNMT